MVEEINSLTGLGDQLCQRGDPAVQTAPASLPPVPGFHGLQRGIQRFRQGGQLQLDGFAAVIAGIVEKALGHFQQYGVVRLLWRQIQRFIYLRQFVMLLHIAAGVVRAALHKHAALPQTVFPPDPLEVQQVEHCVRQIIQFRKKTVFRAEPAQLRVVQSLVHHMTATAAAGQINQP